MKDLIDALLQFSRTGRKAGPLVEVDLNVVLQDVLDDLQSGIEGAHATVKLVGRRSRKSRRTRRRCGSCFKI